MTESLLSNLIVYRNLLNDEIIKSYDDLCQKYMKINVLESKTEYLSKYYELCSELVKNGFDSINDYLANKILIDENTFSLSCEMGQVISDKIKKAVTHDLLLFKKIFDLPLRGIAASAGDNDNFINYAINEKIVDVFRTGRTDEIYEYMHDEYSSLGCGQYRNNYVFSVDENGSIVPVNNFNPVTMENIYGYSSQKNKIINNTEKFISNKYALNALLVGDSGTGKSTAVKALIPMFMDKKLRLIEVEKEKLYHISKIIETLKNRGMYYIIFIDDLSFESNENSYKYLKSAVEGSIYEQPQNILFYVTSNRKHLIKESMIERENEIHIRDAINEQTSLSDRFGLTILYNEPNQQEYFEIALGLADKFNIKYSDKEQFLAEAKKFAMQNGGRTGRTALQFVKNF